MARSKVPVTEPFNPEGYLRTDLAVIAKAHDKAIRALDKIVRKAEDNADNVRDADVVGARFSRSTTAVESVHRGISGIASVLARADDHADGKCWSSEILKCSEDPSNKDANLFRRRMEQYFKEQTKHLREKVQEMNSALYKPTTKQRMWDDVDGEASLDW
jgi:hypothetical protein